MMEFVDEAACVRISDVIGKRRKGRKRTRVALSVAQMKRWTLDAEGELVGTPGTRFENHRLYLKADLPDGTTQELRLVATPCHYGGVRLWFACPKCKTRVGVLYWVGSYACRKCHCLYYRCQAENPGRRSLVYAAGAILDAERRERRIREYFTERYTPKAAERRIRKATFRLMSESLIAEFHERCAKEGL